MSGLQLVDGIAPMPRLPESGAIRAQELSKRFLLNHERRMALDHERFVRGKSPESEEFWALRDATFRRPEGVRCSGSSGTTARGSPPR